jgi:hypothetical protein
VNFNTNENMTSRKDEGFYAGLASLLVLILILCYLFYSGSREEIVQERIASAAETLQKRTLKDEYDDEAAIHRHDHSEHKKFEERRKIFLALTDHEIPRKITPILEAENEDEESSHDVENPAKKEQPADKKRRRNLGYVSRVFNLSTEDVDTSELGGGITFDYRSRGMPLLTRLNTKETLLTAEDDPSNLYPDIDLPDESFYTQGEE